MPKLICTSRYIKKSKSKNAGNLIKYMGTREGVEKLTNDYDNSPATKKQHSLICELLKAYPPAWEYPEFQKYISEHSKGAATECINAFIEGNADQIQDVKKLVSYMAERPGVEKIGKHGLFSQSDDKIDLDKICDEVANHEGVIWTHVVSLTREDAERLGYNKATSWRELVRRNAMQIAEAHKIPISEMKWYAAFHNTTHHPHIHLVVYSENIKHGYLTKKGIDSLHSIFANDIFRNEMYHLFALQTQMRNEIKQEAQQRINELIKRTSENAPCNENFQFLISQLTEQLKKHKGKKLYGYLQKDIKNTVDAIMRELAKDSRIADFYAEWNNINRQKLSIYHDKPDPDIPLENNKEFRSIKNAIIKAVWGLGSNNDLAVSNSNVTNMVTLWVRLLGSMINDSYQKKQSHLNNQIDSKLKSKIEQKKRAFGIKTDHTVKDVENNEQNFTF
ncbi:MAG: relaxase MobL [Oscillospiraceae bacterium]|nr:relaxase MobL [Oscillospiraceae bacterium]